MKEDKKVPQLRFPEFTDAWKQRKLGDILKLLKDGTHGSHKDVTNGHYLLSAKNIKDGRIFWDKTDRIISDEDYKKIHSTFKINKGDVLLTIVGSIGETAIFNVSEEITFQRSVAILRPIDEVSSDFLYSEITSPKFQKFLNLNKSTSAQPGIYLGDLANISFSFPENKEEQKMIGRLFTGLNSTITLQQRKLNSLQKLKKGLLQKMFPKNGENIPEIRFPEFSDAWKQRKFEDWGTFYYGKSCPKWSIDENAKTPCVRYGELYTKFGNKIDKVFSYTNIEPENLRFSTGKEVLIPRVGEDPFDYNHCTWLSIKGIAIGEMISVFNTDQDPQFSATMFNATLKNEFAKRVEGGSVTNLYFEKLKNILIYYPSLEEQKKIASFFERIDQTITLQQRWLFYTHKQS